MYTYVNAGIRSPPTTITRLMVEGLSCQRCHRSNRTPCHWSRWCILSRHCQMVLHVFIHGNTSTMSIRCKFNTVEKCQKEKQSRNTLHQETQLKANATSQSEQHDAASMYCRTNENGRTTARGGENTHTWLGVHFQKKNSSNNEKCKEICGVAANSVRRNICFFVYETSHCCDPFRQFNQKKTVIGWIGLQVGQESAPHYQSTRHLLILSFYLKLPWSSLLYLGH